MTIDLNQLENRLWATANQMWANTGLKPSEFSNPVLGLIFLRYAEKKFHEAETTLLDKGLDASEIEKFDYQAEGALYLPENARFTYLLDLAEDHDLGRAVNEAMAAVETENDELKGVLPRSYGKVRRRWTTTLSCADVSTVCRRCAVCERSPNTERFFHLYTVCSVIP